MNRLGILLLVIAASCTAPTAPETPYAPSARWVNAPQTGDRIETLVDANVYEQASESSTVLGIQPTGSAGTVDNGPKDKNGVTWYLVNFDTGVDGLVLSGDIEEEGGGSPPPPPPPPTGDAILGFVGCSQTRDKGTGLSLYTDVDSWVKLAPDGSKVLQSYSGGTITVWGTPGESGHSIKWGAFESGMAAWPNTNAILWEICIKADDSRDASSYQDDIEFIADRVAAEAPGIPLYVVGMVPYAEGLICSLSGADGPALAQQVADMAIATTAAQSPVGLVLGPLEAGDVKPDGCHANGSGMQKQALQIAAWLADL